MNNNEEIEFNQFQTKIEEVVNILKKMSSSDLPTQEMGIKLADNFLKPAHPTTERVGDTEDQLDPNEFIVRVKDDRTIINKRNDSLNTNEPIGKFAFMSEMERDASRRAKERKEREETAESLRNIGNRAFKNGEYEKAITMYTKAIDQIKDSPILYNNRALTYIRLESYKRAIIDCDFVIQKLDEKNLRSWLYRAKSYHFLEETRDFEKSINEAKKNNPKEIAYIETVVAAIQNRKSEVAKTSDVGVE